MNIYPSMHIGQRVRWREWPDYQTGEIVDINRNGIVVMPDDDSEYWPILQPFQLESIEDN